MNWKKCTEEMPDSDTTVMIYSPRAQEPIWLGYHDGECWRLIDNFKSANVTHWAPMPELPQAISKPPPMKLAASVRPNISYAVDTFFPMCMGQHDLSAEQKGALVDWICQAIEYQSIDESEPVHANPNPRIGVLLKNHGASVRLFNVLNPQFGKRGLKWFQKNWPEERLRRECPGFGNETSKEWNDILTRRHTH